MRCVSVIDKTKQTHGNWVGGWFQVGEIWVWVWNARYCLLAPDLFTLDGLAMVVQRWRGTPSFWTSLGPTHSLEPRGINRVDLPSYAYLKVASNLTSGFLSRYHNLLYCPLPSLEVFQYLSAYLHIHTLCQYKSLSHSRRLISGQKIFL